MSAHPSPLVGRVRELDVLDVALDGARRGFGSLVALTGEAGIGKTRLAEEIAARAVDQGFRTAWGSGWPEGGSPPMWPWQDILEQLGDVDALRVLDGRADVDVLDPERFARFRGIAQAVVRAAGEQPLVVVLDDAQAADVGALLLARFLARSMHRARILLVVTYRIELSAAATAPQVVDALVDLTGEGTRLELLGLDEADMAAVLAGAGRPPDASQMVALRRLTGGNPLLLREALAAGVLDDGAVPSRVRRLLLSRLAPFDDDARSVLAACAVLGASGDDRLIAAVSGAPVAEVRDVCERARSAGLLRRDTASGREGFAHGLLRDALLGEIDPAQQIELHRRIAEELGRLPSASTPEVVTRIAHHRALAAEGGDAAAVASAVAACRVAAAADRRRFAYESAASQLRIASRLVVEGGGTPSPRLLVELAQAELSGGHLRAARAVFREAVDHHDDSTDPVVLAEAAIGLGGIWVYEHRLADEVAGFHGLLRRADAGLGADRPDLQARIRIRLATEAVYLGTGTVDEARVALEEVRRSGDALAVAEGLSLFHHVTLGPHHAAERRPIADELVTTASAAGNAVLTLMGVMWRTIDLLLAGDPQAGRSLQELRQRADALQVHAVLYVVALLDAMTELRAGKVADAEAAAERSFAIGTEVGDADAVAFYGAQLLVIRWLQGRSAEILPLARDVATSPTVVAQDRAFPAALAALAAYVGGEALEEARQALDGLLTAGLDQLPRSSTWLVTLFCVIEAAAGLEDARAADAAYEVLAPFAGQPIMASLAIACLGPVARSLGVAARTAGRLDQAIAHFEAAVDESRRLGNLPVLALCRTDLGLALASRAAPDDEARSQALIDEGVAALESMGLTGRAERIRGGRPAARPAPAGSERGTLRFATGSWTLAAGGEQAVLADGVGVRYLARLLAAPGVEIGADELAGAGLVAARQEVFDEKALNVYRQKIRDLQEDLEEAEDAADIGRADKLRLELDRLLEHVGAQMGLGGQSRSFADERERARTAVQKALRRAIDRVGAAAPTLGEALLRSVRTGSLCSFDPVEGLPADWEISGPR